MALSHSVIIIDVLLDQTETSASVLVKTENKWQ